MRLNKILSCLCSLVPVLLLTACDYSTYEVSSEEASLPEKYDVTVTLNYEEVFLTSNTPMNVYVGDEKLGRQEAGTLQSYSLSLEEGEYVFYLKNDGIYKTDEIKFEVTGDNQTFGFGAKTRLTFGVEVWEE